MKVGIIDYGVGNLGSVFRALEQLSVLPVLIHSPNDIKQVDCLILPGVGSYKESKKRLDITGWTTAIQESVINGGKSILGICLGMQLLGDFGYEGVNEVVDSPTPGLGLIPGEVRSLTSLGCKYRVPHMGWNSIEHLNTSPILGGIPSGTDFYFVHSYAFVVKDSSHIISLADHSIKITSVIGLDNIWGTQFHPEKSSKAGFKLLQNFINSF